MYQCSNESLQWLALPELCTALAYGAPTALVRYYGRDRMFLKMAKIIDSEASEEYGKARGGLFDDPAG